MNPSDRSSDFDSSYGGGYHSSEDLTALDLLDRTIAALPVGDPVRKALLSVRAQIVDQHVGTPRREAQRMGTPEPPARPGDDDNLVLE